MNTPTMPAFAATPRVSRRIFLPSFALRQYIDCFFEFSVHCPTPVSLNILPYNRFDLLFYLQRPPTIGNEGSPMLKTAVGAILGKRIQVHINSRMQNFSIRLKPAGMRLLSKVHLQDVHSTYFAMDDILHDFHKELEEAVYTADTTEQRIQRSEIILLKTIAQLENSMIDFEKIMSYADANPDLAHVDELVNKTGWNRRKLERHFANNVGLSPKHYLRINRLNFAVKNILEQKTLRFTDITYECGFADQAHFNHEVRYFTNVMPSEILNFVSPITRHYNAYLPDELIEN